MRPANGRLNGYAGNATKATGLPAAPFVDRFILINGNPSERSSKTARNTPLQAVHGHCLKCDYRLAWIVILMWFKQEIQKVKLSNSTLRKTGKYGVLFHQSHRP